MLLNLGRAIRRRGEGTLIVELANGQRVVLAGAGPGPLGHIRLVRPRALRRFRMGGGVGAAEAYMDGDWDTVDLSATLEFFALNEARLDRGFAGGSLARAARRLYHMSRENSLRGSRRNISAHYDLGNEFYKAWLDPSLTYSCAIFEPGGGPDLGAAQVGKYRRLCDRLQIGPEHHLLEIGCGWGGFAEYAATNTGCRITGITLSREQHDHARRRIYEAGLAERVLIELRDYREVTGRYDRIASIEMFEAVGERYWPTFFAQIRGRLRTGGLAALQIITIDDSRFERYRRGADFIQRYIFPGGVLPSRTALLREAADAGLSWLEDQRFGPHYAETLAVWRARFAGARERIEALGYPDRFRRMWDFYLAYCEAGFRTGRTDLLQISLSR